MRFLTLPAASVGQKRSSLTVSCMTARHGPLKLLGPLPASGLSLTRARLGLSVEFGRGVETLTKPMTQDQGLVCGSRRAIYGVGSANLQTKRSIESMLRMQIPTGTWKPPVVVASKQESEREAGKK